MTLSNTPTVPRWATVNQAASYLKLHRSSLYVAMTNKGLPYYTIGGTRRLDLNELDAWVTGE